MLVVTLCARAQGKFSGPSERVCAMPEERKPLHGDGQGNRYTAMAIRRASEVASVEQIDRRQGNPHRTLRLNPFPDRNTTNGRLTDCWLTVRLGGSGLGLLRRPEESVGAGVGVGDGGCAGGDPVSDDRGGGGRLLQLVGGGGGLLVEDDRPGAAREKEKF